MSTSRLFGMVVNLTYFRTFMNYEKYSTCCYNNVLFIIKSVSPTYPFLKSQGVNVFAMLLGWSFLVLVKTAL